MTATTPTVSPELKGLLLRVKLGKTLYTLLERLTLAEASKLSHAEFLELLLATRSTVATASAPPFVPRPPGSTPP